MLTAARRGGTGPLLAPVPNPVDPSAHFLDGEGLQGLCTPGLLDVSRAVEVCFARRAMLCVTGASGVGKTFAAHAVARGPPSPPVHACSACPPAPPRPTCARLSMTPFTFPARRPTTPGCATPPSWTRWPPGPQTVVVDEAHQLSLAALEYLRYLYDSLPDGLCTVLIAGEKSESVLRDTPIAGHPGRPVVRDPPAGC
ncbi:ATP-binding protein [Streptomyces mobaraensis NBRC 13819 = DSM 40847]|uniref:ATP-binding protein n=1 Tax=Streptomyces mobaraensis TaxID=35621 RepID=UPI001B3073BC|nr:ATP-binding protein [Streptomyces mobaraensis]QTT72032.1 ATP-binding protein [Streptomyces mobaraensis NBRC 13819 = DSM 40847]QTT77467.1 ATP-binding protein [Streptomyces mobaraensis NBRC 13819 = DSM 40847]